MFDNCDDNALIEPAWKHFETVMQEIFVGWGEVAQRLIIYGPGISVSHSSEV